jgi:hypothetical protein
MGAAMSDKPKLTSEWHFVKAALKYFEAEYPRQASKLLTSGLIESGALATFIWTHIMMACVGSPKSTITIPDAASRLARFVQANVASDEKKEDRSA